MLKLHKERCMHHMLIMGMLIMFTCNQLKVVSTTTPPDLPLIPQLCDPIQCPAEADMQCPEDSSIRDIREINAVDLMNSNVLSTTSTSAPLSNMETSSYNSSMVPEELFAQCCLSKKCVCKTCYIPDCNSEEGEVVVELQPEAMDTPGQCCGRYECQREPNCSEVWDTENYWLQSCQRCLCTSGSKLCQQSCDEGTNAICESKNLNTFYKDGESWEDGCYQCECVKGEPKCTIPFCGQVNCPSERQVNLKGTCCPVCWPKGEPMPHEKPRNYDDGYGYEHLQPQQQEQPPQTHQLESETKTDAKMETYTVTEVPAVALATTTISSSSTTQRAATNAELNINPTTAAPATAPPCQLHDFPNVVEVVHQNTYNHLYPIIIVILLITIAVMYLYIRHLHAKQRSYRPVSNFDDKV